MTKQNTIPVGMISDLNDKVLTLDNVTPYTPTEDYNPATVKYVNDSIVTEVNQAYINVLDMGAVGNGVVDDTAAIQAALDLGGLVIVPVGTYLLEGTLYIDSHTTLYLQGKEAVMKRGAATSAMLLNKSNGTIGVYGANSHINVVGGTWDGQRTAFGASCTLVAFGHATEIHIKDATFTGIPGWHAVEYNAVDHSSVKACLFQDYDSTGTEYLQIDVAGSPEYQSLFPWFGPYDQTPCSNIEVSECRFENGIDGVGAHSSWVGSEQTNINIHDNTFIGMSGICVKADNWDVVRIISNYMKSVHIGIKAVVKAGSILGDYNISNNAMLNVSVDSESRGIWILGNIVHGVIHGNQLQTVSKHGIGVDLTRDWVISNNDVIGCGQTGIWLYGTSDSVVSGNRSVGNALTGRFDFTNGDSVQSTDNNVVTGNIFGSVYLFTATDTIMSNNQISALTNTADASNMVFNNYINNIWVGDGDSGTSGVTSINGETGVVVLNQDTILPGVTYAQTHNDYTDADKTAVAGITGSTSGWVNITTMAGYNVNSIGVALAEAVASLGATGGVIYVPAGVHTLTEQWVVTDHNITLQGDGMGSSIISATFATTDVIVIGSITLDIDNCAVRDIQITSTVPRTGAGVKVVNGHNIKINHLKLNQNMDVGVDLQAGNGDVGDGQFLYYVEHLEVNSGSDAILIGGEYTSPVQDVWLSKMILAGLTGAGIRMKHCSGVYMSEIDVIDAEWGILADPDGAGTQVAHVFMDAILGDTCHQDGIALTPTNSAAIKNFQMSNCWGATNTLRGMRIASGTGVIYGIALSTCRFTNNKREGLYVAGVVDALSVVGTQFTGNSGESTNTYHGVYLGPGVSDFIFTGCVSGNPTAFATAHQRYGLFLDSGASDNYIITDCNFQNNAQGAYIDGGTGTNKVIENILGAASSLDKVTSVNGATGAVTISTSDTPYYFSRKGTAAQTVGVTFESINFGNSMVSSGHDTTLGFTAPVAGLYQFNMCVRVTYDQASNTYLTYGFEINGVYYNTSLTMYGGSTQYPGLTLSHAIVLAAGDFVEVVVICGAGSVATLPTDSFWSGFLIKDLTP